MTAGLPDDLLRARSVGTPIRTNASCQHGAIASRSEPRQDVSSRMAHAPERSRPQ